MIIKEITIQNFRSYYGTDNRFEFSDRLTLILGDNGDGKTTLFEALQWLLDVSQVVGIPQKGDLSLLSAMCRREMEVGETATVSVSMTFDHDGEKRVEKSFSVERTEKAYVVGNLRYQGTEVIGSERVPAQGPQLIHRCYDSFMQKLSMFKGESELDVFNDATSLGKLVEQFSDIRCYDELVKVSSALSEKAEKAYNKALRDDKKISRQASDLEKALTERSEELIDLKKRKREHESDLTFYTSRLDELERSKSASEAYHTLNERLEELNSKARKIKADINRVDTNHALLDDLWILCAFPPILKEFVQKCSALSKERRSLQSEWTKQQGKIEGKLEAIKDIRGALEGGALALPWDLPDEATMQEMLDDHICKVCGRPAPEGSDAYNFMKHKLEEYRRHLNEEKRLEEDRLKAQNKELYVSNQISTLRNLSVTLSGEQEKAICDKAKEISDSLSLTERRKSDLHELEKDIEEIQNEKTRLLIHHNVDEALMEKNFSDVKGFFDRKEQIKVDLAHIEERIAQLTTQCEELKQQRNQLDPDNVLGRISKRIYNLMEAIANAFARAKEANLRSFLSALEEKANEYLNRLSSADFHGEVRLVRGMEDKIQIHLFSGTDENRMEVIHPSGSQRTVMYISVLFAISDFTKEKRSENYPLLFDAATSSFGDAKEQEFYNIINGLQKQCVIVTKDFIDKGQVRMKDVEKLSCTVYRIKKATGFDASDLATVKTTITRLQ